MDGSPPTNKNANTEHPQQTFAPLNHAKWWKHNYICFNASALSNVQTWTNFFPTSKNTSQKQKQLYPSGWHSKQASATGSTDTRTQTFRTPHSQPRRRIRTTPGHPCQTTLPPSQKPTHLNAVSDGITSFGGDSQTTGQKHSLLQGPSQVHPVQGNNGQQVSSRQFGASF